ncbi:hypothetical protein MmTuc01_0438 [Methanosarcina mazei Tuc01]|uniref:Uncharacterized protein n=1 Tax=Methanosarcina mazei Tuc01 TaxID=1236903 RepID=M1Q0T0_METMZ|nr:hypothetical protein MmTuc01_0438 [Methanosarcina mazei Tuc01]
MAQSFDFSFVSSFSYSIPVMKCLIWYMKRWNAAGMKCHRGKDLHIKIKIKSIAKEPG